MKRNKNNTEDTDHTTGAESKVSKTTIRRRRLIEALAAAGGSMVLPAQAEKGDGGDGWQTPVVQGVGLPLHAETTGTPAPHTGTHASTHTGTDSGSNASADSGSNASTS